MSKTNCLYKIIVHSKVAKEIQGKMTYEVRVPCGKCERCIERRKMEWGFRMEEEMKISKTCYFVTLTYDSLWVPYNKYGQKTLVPYRLNDKGKRYSKGDTPAEIDISLQGYWKRLRQAELRSDTTRENLFMNLNKGDKIKYYACGEYGENNTQRPHFHAIIFNASECNIKEAWPYGNVMVLKGMKNTIAYVMKYLDKRYGKEKEWKREPEFNTMSEGIGLEWVEKNKEWYKQNIDIMFVVNSLGFRIPMPKYYRDKIFDELDREYQINLIEERLAEKKEKLIKEVGKEEYWKADLREAKMSEIKFNKKVKKRNID